MGPGAPLRGTRGPAGYRLKSEKGTTLCTKVGAAHTLTKQERPPAAWPHSTSMPVQWGHKAILGSSVDSGPEAVPSY